MNSLAEDPGIVKPPKPAQLTASQRPGKKSFPVRQRGRSVQFTTVADVLDWYGPQDVGSLVDTKERRRVRALFRRSYGGLELATASPADIHAFLDSQSGARAAWTRRRMRATLQRPFNFAARLGLLPRNPFLGVGLPAGNRGRDWTAAEYQTVLRHSEPEFRRLVVFLRFSGARPGEARALRWEQVQLDRGCCILAEHKTARRYGAGPRRIYLNRVSARLLLWLSRRMAGPLARAGQAPRVRLAMAGALIQAVQVKVLGALPGERTVFVNSKGRPWTKSALTQYLLRLRRRLGLPEDLKLHGCRHTFATGAILNGVDVATLGQLLGHRSLRSTEVYLHMAGQNAHLAAAADRACARLS
jgi:integrase